VKNLRALVQAIRGKDAPLAETILREEVSKAAEEVHRLLKDGAAHSHAEKPAAS
jgi:DNA-binding GntR family transcriptional regulator